MKRSVLVTAFSAMLSALGAVSGPDHKVKSQRREFRTESATRRACARCGLNSNAATVSQAADPATQAGHHRAQSAGRLLLKRMSEPVGVAVQPQLKCNSPPLHTMEHGGVHERIERKDQEPPPLHG